MMTERENNFSWFKYSVMTIIIAAVYFIAARLSLFLAIGNTNASPVWPPSGIAFAVIFLLGYRLGPAVFLGAFFANISVLQGSGLAPVYFLTASFTTAAGNMLEGIAGVYFIRRFTAADNPFENIKDLFTFIVYASLLSTMISATIGVFSYCFVTGNWPVFSQVCLTWWLGDASGILIVSPLIILLGKEVSASVTSIRLREAVPVFIILAGVSLMIFRNNNHVEYVIIPLLLWIALRFGRFYSACAVLLVSGIAILCAVTSSGSPGNEASLLFLQTYIGVISIITLSLSVLAHERSESDRSRIAVQKQLFDIIEFLPDATFAIDINGKVIAWNRAMEDLSGISKKNMIGKSDYEYALPFFGKRRPILIDLVMSDPDLALLGTYEYIEKKGSVLFAERYNTQLNRHLSGAASALIDSSGTVYGAIESIRDISDRKAAELELKHYRENLEEIVAERSAELVQANEQLIRAKEHAEAADRIKSAFLATMSHELRTPLNSIIGFTGIIIQGLAGPLTDEQKKQMNMVRNSAKHLLSLINDVLDISKIEAGQFEVYAEPFDLVPVIEKAAATVKPSADKKGIELKVNVLNEIGKVRSDIRRVEQVLLNLLTNAIKFTDSGSVNLTAELISGYKPSVAGCESAPVPAVQIRVSDTGIGIAPDELRDLFQPFRQVDTGLARKNEGTGLGLAICRRLADLMGGEVTAESEPGRGSVFTFIIPVDKKGIL